MSVAGAGTWATTLRCRCATGLSYPPRRTDMANGGEAFVGIDAAKLRNAVAVAEAGRDGEVRYLGEIEASPEAMRRLVSKLAAKFDRLHFCYEAGPTGYGLHRLIVELGHDC